MNEIRRVYFSSILGSMESKISRHDIWPQTAHWLFISFEKSREFFRARSGIRVGEYDEVSRYLKRRLRDRFDFCAYQIDIKG